jgi:hypothetical protein
MTVHFNAGPQHMNGATALIYARSRHSYDNGEGSDFARSRRQQLVLAALKQKLVSVNGIAKLPDVLGALGGHVITDLSIGDAKALYDLVKNVDSSSIERVSIDDTNFLYSCGYPTNCSAWYLYAHDTTYASLSKYVGDIFPPTAALTENVPVSVVDASGRGAGASTRWAALLKDVKLNATDGGRAATSATTHVLLNGGGTKGAQTAQYLASLFGVSVENVAPSASAGTASGATPSVTVVLGTDEEQWFNHTTTSYYGSSGGSSSYSSHTYTSTHTATHTSTSTDAGTPEPTQPPTPTPSSIVTVPPVPSPTPKHTPNPTPSPSPG